MTLNLSCCGGGVEADVCGNEAGVGFSCDSDAFEVVIVCSCDSGEGLARVVGVRDAGKCGDRLLIRGEEDGLPCEVPIPGVYRLVRCTCR